MTDNQSLTNSRDHSKSPSRRAGSLSKQPMSREDSQTESKGNLKGILKQ